MFFLGRCYNKFLEALGPSYYSVTDFLQTNINKQKGGLMGIVLGADTRLFKVDEPSVFCEAVSNEKPKITTIFSAELTEDVYYKWTDELIAKCNNLAISVEVHLPHKVYISSSAVFSKNLSALVIGLSALDSKILKDSDLSLDKCIKPIIIKEGGWDCVQFGFRNGYVVIYFNKPK